MRLFSGGPEAEIEMIIKAKRSNKFEIKIFLENANLPDGIVGTYEGTKTETGYIFGYGSMVIILLYTVEAAAVIVILNLAMDYTQCVTKFF